MLVRIADEVLDFTPGHTDFFEKRMEEYLVDGEFERGKFAPDMTMTVLLERDVLLSDGEKVQSIETQGMTSRRLSLNKSEQDELAYDYEIINYSRQGDAISKIRYKADYSNVEIVINKRFRPRQITLCDYEYLLTGAWFAYFLSRKNGMMLHSSAMKFQDKGELFSGNPGAGKSTHVGLWEKYYGGQVEIINDDKPIIKYVDDVAYVYGTPWSGKTDKNSNSKVALDKIFFVVQAKENALVHLNRRDAVVRLFSQVQKPYQDAELINHNLTLIDKIVREHGVYELQCDINRGAVEKVREVIDCF